jgi:hypothetical protein
MGFFTLSVVRYSTEHDVSETLPLSVLWRHLFCLDCWKGLTLNHCPALSPKGGNISSLRHAISLECRTMVKIQKLTNPEVKEFFLI